MGLGLFDRETEPVKTALIITHTSWLLCCESVVFQNLNTNFSCRICMCSQWVACLGLWKGCSQLQDPGAPFRPRWMLQPHLGSMLSRIPLPPNKSWPKALRHFMSSPWLCWWETQTSEHSSFPQHDFRKLTPFKKLLKINCCILQPWAWYHYVLLLD